MTRGAWMSCPRSRWIGRPAVVLLGLLMLIGGSTAAEAAVNETPRAEASSGAGPASGRSGPVEIELKPEVESLSGLEARSAALLLSGQQGGQIAGDLLWLAKESGGGSEVEIPFYVELEGASLVAGLVSDEDDASAADAEDVEDGEDGEIQAAQEDAANALELELHAYLLHEGTVVTSISQLVRLQGPGLIEQVRHRGVKMVGRLFAEASTLSLCALVRERTSDRFFLARSRLELGDGNGGMALLLPPVFADTHQGWISAPLQGLGPDSFQLALGAERLAPAALPALVKGRSNEMFLVGAAWPEGATVSGVLHFRKGRLVPLEELRLGRERALVDGGLRVHEATVRPPELHPGIYDLELVLNDATETELARQVIQVAVVPEPVDESEGSAGPARAIASELGSSETRATYLRALRLMCDGDRDAARQIIDDLESNKLADDGPDSLDRLRETELQAVERLVAGRPGVAAPVVMLHHDLFYIYMLRSDYLLESHAWQLTADLAELAAQSDPANRQATVEVMVSLASYLLDNEDLDSARSLLERALTFSGDDRPALMTLAAIHERQGEYRKAGKVLRHLVDLDDTGSASSQAGRQTGPSRSEERLRLAVNLVRLDKDRQASEILQGLVDGCEEPWICSLAYQALARLMVEDLQLREAAEMLAKGIERLPDPQRLQVQRAFLLERAGRPADADALLDSIRPPSDPRYTSPRWRYTQWPAVGIEATRRRLSEGAMSGIEGLAQALGPEPTPQGQLQEVS